VNQAVQQGVSDGGVADGVVPLRDGVLAGHREKGSNHDIDSAEKPHFPENGTLICNYLRTVFAPKWGFFSRIDIALTGGATASKIYPCHVNCEWSFPGRSIIRLRSELRRDKSS
jgi:hypothetical protein